MDFLKKDFIKRKYFIIIICVVFLISCFFSCKVYYLMKYNIKDLTDLSYEELLDIIEFTDTMTINKTRLKSNEEYLEFENVKIRNDFKDYKEFMKDEDLMEDYSSYKLALYDKEYEDVINSSFWISKWKTNAHFIRNSNSLELFAVGEVDGKIKDTFYRDLLIDNNINSDLELLEFLRNDNVKKVNVFSSNYDIKKLYAKTLFLTITIPNSNHLTKIDGDYNGFMSNSDNVKEVNIEIGEDKYYFTFIDKNNMFTKEYINDLLNTLVIE